MKWQVFTVFIVHLFFVAKTEAQKLLYENSRFEEVVKDLEKFDYYLSAEGNIASIIEINGILDLNRPIASLNILLNHTPYYIQKVDSTNLSLTKIKPQSFCGIFWDARNNEPLIQAHITGRSDQVAVTDSDGKVQMEWRAISSDSVLLSTIGYQPKRLSISELRNCDTLKYRLDINELQTIVVGDYVTTGISSSASGFSKDIRQERLPAIAGNATQDLLINVQQLPGVYSASGNAIDLNVRGGNSDQNLILWDEIPVYKLGHVFGEISSFSPLSTEEIQVFTGGYSSRYGGRISSAILMDPLGKNIDNELSVHVDMLQYMAKAKLTDRKKSLFGSISYRHSFAPNWNSVTLEKHLDKVFQLTQVDEAEQLAQAGAVTIGEDVGFYDWQGKVVWRPWNKLQLGLSYFEAEQSYTYGNEFTLDRLTTSNRLFNASDGYRVEIKYDISKHWKMRVHSIGSNYIDTGDFQFSGRRTNDQLNSSSSANRVKQDIIRFESTYILNDHEMLVGTERNNSRTLFQVMNQEEERSADSLNHTLERSVIFGEWSFKNPNWDLSAGLRWITTTEDLLPQQILTNSYFEPRLRVAHKVGRDIWLRASMGRYHQFISQFLRLDRNPYSGSVTADIWFLSISWRNTIPVVINNQRNIGIKWQNSHWLVDLEAYWKNIDGITSLSSATAFQADIGLVPGDSRARGIDLMLRYGKSNFKSWFTYSYSDVDYHFPSLRNERFSANHEIEHRLKSTTEIHYGDFSIGFSYMIRSGLPYIQPVSFIRNAQNSNNVQPVIDEINSERLPAVKQFDLSLVYSLKKSKQTKAKIGLDLRNLFDQQNIHQRSVAGYIPEGNDNIQTINVERYYLRFTPNLFVKYFIL